MQPGSEVYVRPLSELWLNQKESIFSVMSREAINYRAINLAQGFPDFDGPGSVKAAATEALQSGKNQYAPSPGLPALRKVISNYEAQRYGLSYDPDTEVTVLSGATEALFCTLQALCNPGDEIIAFEPYYDSYLPGALTAGAKLVTLPLTPPDWGFDREKLKSLINPNTKAIILNSPHNPTGKVFNQEELTFIADLAVSHDLWVMTDEVYEELVFDGCRHVPIASLEGMKERTVTISSTSKTFSFTGWKVGYAFAPPEVTRAIRAVHQNTVFCSATPLQHGLIAAFSSRQSYYEQLRTDYLERRDILLDILRNSGFKAQAPQGTYFIMADYSAIREFDDLTFSMWLTREIGVACIPLSPFCLDQKAAASDLHYVRMGFCKSKDTLYAAGEKLLRLKNT